MSVTLGGLLFYGGIAGMIGTLVAGLTLAVIFPLEKRKLIKRIEEEF